MAVRKFKPTTPGQRHKIIGTFEEITASVPEKSLVFGKRSTGGRNNVGKMTMRYMGGGHKRKYRLIDFKRNKDGVPAVVKTIEYDRIVRLVLLCCFMLMVKRDILLLLMDCKLVAHWCLERMQRLRLVTHFRLKTFPLVL